MDRPVKDPEVRELPGDVMELQLGPSHPAMHGIVRLNTKVAGEKVVDMNVEIGFLHRGFEKMCEHRTYNQNIVFTDRLNYCSAPANGAAYMSAIERLAGIEIPVRAKWLRVMYSEIARLTDHLVCIGASMMELGAFSAYLYLIQAREEWWFILDKICGARLTTSMSRVGGERYDLYQGWQEDFVKSIAFTRKILDDSHALLTRNRIFYDRMRGVGVVSEEKAIDLGFTGPVLRSTGSDYDVRKANPYWVYDQVDFDVPVGKYGDNYDRYLVRMEEMEQSLRILEQSIEKIPDGPYYVGDTHQFLQTKEETYASIEGLVHHFELFMRGASVPPGEAYFAIEAPNGEHGYYVVSDGSKKGLPYRVRARPTCLPMTMALPELCRGYMIADIVPTFGSINMIGGELER